MVDVINVVIFHLNLNTSPAVGDVKGGRHWFCRLQSDFADWSVFRGLEEEGRPGWHQPLFTLFLSKKNNLQSQMNSCNNILVQNLIAPVNSQLCICCICVFVSCDSSCIESSVVTSPKTLKSVSIFVLSSPSAQFHVFFLLLKTCCLRYPQCNLATEWHHWGLFIRLQMQMQLLLRPQNDFYYF